MGEDNLSLEPLLNQSSIGDGSSRRVAFVVIDAVGAVSNRATVSVTSTAAELTPTTGKRTIEIQNTGTNEVYYGGSGVDDTTGIIIRPQGGKIFANVKDSFSIYFVCSSGETSTLRVVEYD